jgi:hypothetical protein
MLVTLNVVSFPLQNLSREEKAVLTEALQKKSTMMG